jgi:signal transduction histidine kinase
VSLALRYRPGIVDVEVTDDGAGALPGPGQPRQAGTGHGLVGMRERVAVHGGRFTAGPRLGGGWHLTAEVPWT